MTFPVYLQAFGWKIHPHLFFESVAYFVAARVYFAARRRTANANLVSDDARLWILVGCLFGAWAGSKLLAWAEAPHYFAALQSRAEAWLGGKTIVGGLLGGWLGVEVAKRVLRIKTSTGDAFVWPMALGTAIGRLGCFFTGLADRTYGTATSLPWGVDFGDGVRRHPTQLYEAVFVLVWALLIHAAMRHRRAPAGVRFRLYLAGYLGFRAVIEFLKPRETLFTPFSAIQLASFAGAAIAVVSLVRLVRAASVPLRPHGSSVSLR